MSPHDSLGGNVTLRLYPNMDHTINDDELDVVRSILHTAKGQ